MQNTNGRIWTQFKIPDVYGVYQFRINYLKLGLTRLQTTTQVHQGGGILLAYSGLFLRFLNCKNKSVSRYAMSILNSECSGFYPSSPAQPVRAVYRLRLPVLRELLLHDVRRVRVRPRLPPLQGGRTQEEGGVEGSRRKSSKL